MSEVLNGDCTVLANLSGGLDSIYGVWKLLESGEKVLIHHCHLAGNQRLPWESRATEKALDWYMDHGLLNFDYVQSYVQLPPARYRSRMRDPDLIMIISGQILRDRTHIKRLAYFNNVDDTSTRYPKVARSRVRTMQRWARRRDVEVFRPLVRMSKADIVRELPAELLTIGSWCRFPDGTGAACHGCIPCRAVDAARNDVTEGNQDGL